MTTITIHHHCTDFDSYRAARVKSLFNVENGADVHIEAALPLDLANWRHRRAIRQRQNQYR